jgi:hypothetical protein
MKKLLICAMLLAGNAAAFEMGITTSSDKKVTSTGIYGAQKFDKFSVQVGFDTFESSKFSVDRYSVLIGYDLFTFKDITTTVKIGDAYLEPSTKYLKYGHSVIQGVGVSYPVAKNVSVTLDYQKQRGETSVKVLSGEVIFVGFKYNF